MEIQKQIIATPKMSLFKEGMNLGVLLLGVAVLLGWQFDIDFLKRPLPGSVAMNPLTAIGFILSSSALFFLRSNRTLKLLSLLILGLGVVKLFAEVSGLSIPIDTTLFHSKLQLDLIKGISNRMAPNSAIGFVFVGSAFFLRTFQRNTVWLIELLTFLGLTQGVLSIVGYGFKVPEFYGILSMFPMAVHTATGFVLLTLAMLTIQPLGPFMYNITSKGPGGLMAKLLLPLAILLPIALGALKLYGERQKLYSSEFGLMLIVVIVILIFCIIIWRVAVLINEKDEKQQQIEIELEELNTQLEEKVIERTAQAIRSRNEALETAKRLVESETHFRETLDNMLEGVQIIGYDWKYRYINKALIVQGGYSWEQLKGRTMAEMYPGLEQAEVYKEIERCLIKRVTSHFETQFVFPDGKSTWFEMSIQPVPEGVFMLSIDITERKRAESELQELNASLEETIRSRTSELQASNKELEAFSYSVSHDLRAPLRAVNGFSQMLEQQHSNQLDDNGKRLLSIIGTNALAMGNLIDDLLEFSKTGRTELQKTDVDMHAIVLEAFGEELDSTPEKANRVNISVLPSVNCDPRMMRQVWMNLISNALKYSSTVAEPKVSIWADVEDGQTVFHIQDNGVGFDMQYADKLFGVFQRLHSKRDFEGTGVGLALAHRIVTKHGGSMWGEAELNKGATFHFALPSEKRNHQEREVELNREEHGQ